MCVHIQVHYFHECACMCGPRFVNDFIASADLGVGGVSVLLAAVITLNRVMIHAPGLFLQEICKIFNIMNKKLVCGTVVRLQGATVHMDTYVVHFVDFLFFKKSFFFLMNKCSCWFLCYLNLLNDVPP